MEKVKEELEKLINLNNIKEQINKLNKNINEKKLELENLNSKVQLQISGTPLRDMAQKELEISKKELEKMQEDKEKQQKELTEKFEKQKEILVSKIEEEMKKYITKSKLNNLKSSKNAYERVADNAEKTVQKLIKDFNEGKIIDQSMLISAKKEMNTNREEAAKVEEELKGYIEIDSNVEQYSDLEYLKIRMQSLTLDQLDEKTEEKFYKKYFENTKTEPEKAEPAKAEPTKVEPTKAEPAKAEPTKVEPTKVEPTKVEPAKTEPEKAEPTKPEPAKVEPTKAEPAKAEPTQDSIKAININKKNGRMYINEQEDKRIIISYGENQELDKMNTIKQIFEDEKECERFINADPNIVEVLKNDKTKLQEYAKALNKGISKEDFAKILKIKYNIKGLASSDLSKEEKKAIIEYAKKHRNIAEIECGIFQKFKWIVEDLGDKIKNIGKTKMITDGIKTSPVIDEGISKEAKEKIQQMVEDKNKNPLKDRITVDNTKNKIENNAVNKLNETSQENILRKPTEQDLNK